MCKLVLDQEASLRVLAVGHKVVFDGAVATIEGIRVWHDALIREYPVGPVFDLALVGGGRAINVHLRDIGLYRGEAVAPSVLAPKLVIERRTSSGKD